jgi:indole-3-glycerol phosphate synthase
VSDALVEICTRKREHVAAMKARRPLAAVVESARSAPPPRGFATSLQRATSGGRYGLIAEIKKASPSAGLIRADFDPVALARAYERAGASCLSVLTDEPYFQGKDAFLTAARAAVSLPVLRKDFMVDAYQIPESRAIGADCVLLILAVLDDALARDLESQALAYGMEVLIEVHDEAELDRALALRSPLVGINNRNLRTLKTDTATTRRLAARVPKDRIVISESGLRTGEDLAEMRRAGVGCFLIGESLMKARDVEAATRALLQSAPVEGRA